MSALTILQAEELLKQYNKEDFHLRHGKIVSDVLGQLAKLHDSDNVEYWQVVGMLHDIDFELYPQEHCIKSQEILASHGVSPDIIRSCASHCYQMGVDIEPIHIMEKYLYATDELTGLIGAVALMRPSKSVQDLELKSVMKKYKTLNFAAGCSREVIQKGADMLGITLDELINQTIAAMREIEGL